MASLLDTQQNSFFQHDNIKKGCLLLGPFTPPFFKFEVTIFKRFQIC